MVVVRPFICSADYVFAILPEKDSNSLGIISHGYQMPDTTFVPCLFKVFFQRQAEEVCYSS